MFFSKLRRILSQDTLNLNQQFRSRESKQVIEFFGGSRSRNVSNSAVVDFSISSGFKSMNNSL